MGVAIGVCVIAVCSITLAATQMVARADGGGAIDTSSRDAVQQAYLTRLKPALAVPMGWTGSASTCNAGTISEAAHEAALTSVNYYRAMGGLQPVSFSPALSADAQQAALMMEAARSLSHTPAASWPCFSASGSIGAGRSNLSLGNAGARAVASQMADGGSNNYAVGHRRWIMFPEQTVMGHGSTSSSQALYVVDQPTWRANLLPSDPDVMRWPTAGYFPSQVEPAGRWSLYENQGTNDFSQAVLTVTRHDGPVDVVMTPTVLTRAGMLVWQFDPGFRTGMADRTYTVKVTGAIQDGVPTNYEYDVTLFDAEVDRAQPARLMDTRFTGQTIDFTSAGIGERGTGSVTELKVTDRATVPLAASSVIVNLTVTEPRSAGFITVFPCGSDRPTASSLNFTAGATLANVVFAKVGAGGKICIFTSAPTHVIVDLSGYYEPGAAFVPVAPARVLETRPGLLTADGDFNGVGFVASGSTVELSVVGRVGVPAGAGAVALNITATEPEQNGFVTVYPCGAARPTASNLNYQAGSTVANLVVSKVGVGGRVCVFTSAGTHLVVDVAGYFQGTTGIVALSPARLLETRTGLETVDGAMNGTGLRQGGTTTVLSVAGRGGVPAQARTVVLNVTATESTGPGFVTVFPCGQSQPKTSSLNLVVGKDVANTVVTRVGADGTVCLFTMAGTHLVVDVNASSL